MEPGSTGSGSFCGGKQPSKCDTTQLLTHYLAYIIQIVIFIDRLSPFVCVKKADPVVVLNDNNSVIVISNRLQEGSVPPLEQGMVVGQLVLADALIIGNCNNQVLTH